MTIRLFAGLAIPEAQADRLQALQRGVLGAAWRPRDAFHLTLRFFGEIDGRVADDLVGELDAIRVPPFEIALQGAGWFGRQAPSALWIGVTESEPLRDLARACERAARRVRLEPDSRPYTPHVTLAYCRGTQPDDAAKFEQRLSLFRSDPFEVDAFALYSSWLGKGPSSYVVEDEFALSA